MCSIKELLEFLLDLHDYYCRKQLISLWLSISPVVCMKVLSVEENKRSTVNIHPGFYSYVPYECYQTYW